MVCLRVREEESKMKRSIILNLVVSVSFVMLTMTSGFAASASSFKYSESYNQKAPVFGSIWLL